MQCATLIRPGKALSLQEAVVHQSASTVVYALSARSAVVHQSAARSSAV